MQLVMIFRQIMCITGYMTSNTGAIIILYTHKKKHVRIDIGVTW